MQLFPYPATRSKDVKGRERMRNGLIIVVQMASVCRYQPIGEKLSTMKVM